MEPGLLYTNYYTNALRQLFFHRCCGLISHVGEYVRVGVQGYGDGSMAKHLGNDLGFMFLDSSSVAHVCRRSWKRICGSFNKGLKRCVVM